MRKPTPTGEMLLGRVDNTSTKFVSRPLAYARELDHFTQRERLQIARLLLGGHLKVYLYQAGQDSRYLICRALPSRV